MGTFQGHALPGAFFIGFALWWLTQIPRRVQICQQSRIPFYTTMTYPCLCLRWPVESAVKLVTTGLGIALELFASTDYGQAGKIVYWSDIQHVTMYLMFCVSSVIEILRYKNCSSVPAGSEFLCNALAFGAELLLFRFHLHGRTSLDVLLHTLLLYAIAGCVLSILLELRYRDSVLASLARAYFTLLQGTWFWQVGFVLYPPTPRLSHWADADQDQMMTITMMFAWHAAADFLVCLGIFAGMSRVYRRYCGGRGIRYELLDYGDTEFEKHLQESMTSLRTRDGADVNSEDDV